VQEGLETLEEVVTLFLISC